MMARHLATGSNVIDMFDWRALRPSDRPPLGGVRLPDGRTLAWTQYGRDDGVPCLLLPETGSSRLAPRWLLHDTALPQSVRLLALDRPGIGASDPVRPGGRKDPAEDLRHLVETLAVGRVAVIGIGQGASEALAFATRYPMMLTTVLAIGPPMLTPRPTRHHWLRPPGWPTPLAPAGPMADWLRAAGRRADLTAELTWARATSRMNPAAARLLGQRWRDADFRQAIASDLSQTSASRTTPALAPPPPDWEHHTCPVPLHIWHGRDETSPTLAHVQTIADQHAWPVTAVNGCSALFGAWPQILHTAADSFHHTAA